MAQVELLRRNVEYQITLNEDEALYLYAALSLVNPTDEKWDATDGDPIYTKLRDAMFENGIVVDDIDSREYAEVI